MKPTHMTTHNNGYRNQQHQRVMHAPSSPMVFCPRTSDIIHNPSRSELLCRYPSKLCDNIRSEKRGGGLHRFCAFHRERANINQRRVDHRRRLRRRGGHVSPIDRLRERDVPHSSDDEHEHHDHALAQEMVSLDIDTFGFDACEPLCSALSEDDLQVLIQLLDEPHASYNSSDEQHMISIKDEPKHEFR